MVDEKAAPTDEQGEDTDAQTTSMSRRRLIQAAGVGLLGSSALIARGSARNSPDRLEIVADRGSSITYSFTCGESIKRVQANSAMSAEKSEDAITENADGTWTATGLTEDGYGDAYLLEGTVFSFKPATGDYTLYLNGNRVTHEELVPLQSHRLVIETPSDGSVEYTMTTEGEIVKDLDNGTNSAEKKNDTVTQNSDGTWTVTGLTGNGYGDTFDLRGDALAFEPKAGDFSLTLDGAAVTPYELIGEEEPYHRLEIVTPEDGSVEYEFTTTGEIVKDLDNGTNSAEADNDTVTQNADGTWTATGLTGNGYGDTYEFEGDVLSFSPTSGDYALYLDNVQVTVAELTGDESTDSGSATTTASDGGAIGGGSGYSGTIARADADYVVRSVAGIASALSSASSGEIVYVAGDAVIDTGTTTFTVPDGVTLASNRGIDGAPGALLHTQETPQIMLRPKANSRVTGLRLRGVSPGQTVTHKDGISYDTPTYAMRLEGGDVEVDNCQVWGWPDRAISVQYSGAHIHHNYIFDNNGQGLGYGVAAAKDCLIEYNYFHNNRHSVTCAYSAPGYVARYNHFSSVSVLHICDIHDPFQGDTNIASNIIENGESRTWDNPNAEGIAGYSGGFDGGTLTVTDNWFFDQGSAYDDRFSEVRDSGNVFGGEGSYDPADIIPNHPGLADRPWL